MVPRVGLLVTVVVLSDMLFVALLVSRVDVDAELLVLVAVLRVEPMVPVVLPSDVVLVALLVSRVDVDVELLDPAVVICVERLIPVALCFFLSEEVCLRCSP